MVDPGGMPPVAPVNAKPEAARFAINWLSAAGTGVFVAALLSGLVLKLNASQWKGAFVQTAHRMKIPVLVIGQVLGLGFLTRYSGTDAVLGLATGNTPIGMYKELVAMYKAGQLDFAQVRTFNLDEYLGLGPDQPGHGRFVLVFAHIDADQCRFVVE